MFGVPLRAEGIQFAHNEYSYGQYPPTGDNYIEAGYRGDWVKFASAECFTIKSSQFVVRPDCCGGRTPGLFKIYARNLDTEAWSVVYTHTTKSPTADTIVPLHLGADCYLQYALVVNALFGTSVVDELINFISWNVMGRYGSIVGPNDVAVSNGAAIQFPPFGATVQFGPVFPSAITMTISNAAVANGAWQLSWSSNWNNQYWPYNVFNPSVDSTGALWAEPMYTAGVYHGESSLDGGVYKGDWLSFKAPSCLQLETSAFVSRDGYLNRSPGLYRIYAKNLDTDPWTLMYTHSVKGDPTDIISIDTGGVCYLQYALVVHELYSTAEVVLNFRSWTLNGIHSPPQLVTTETASFNAVNPVTSLYAPVDTTWTWPVLPTPTYTRCWSTRNNITTDWKVACFKNNPSEYVIDQVDSGSPGEAPLVTDAAAFNHLHAMYTWEEALTTAEMKIVTAGIRKELGGVPLSAGSAIAPIDNLRAYYFRLLLAIHQPQSINIFADVTGTGIGATVANRMGPGFEATVTAGTFSKVTTIEGPESGATNPLTTLVGGTNTKILWPENSLPAIMTICTVTRYGTVSSGRILDAYGSPTQSENWAHGHTGNRRGLAFYGWYYTEWLTFGILHDWLVMCGSTSHDWPGNVVIDQVDRGSVEPDQAANAHETSRLSINYLSSQRSDFNLHSVYIWDVELSNKQMHLITGALRAQIGGTPDGTDQVPVVPMEVTPTAYCAQCPTGAAMHNGLDACSTCPDDTYGIDCTDCPAGTSAPPGSDEISDCICALGYNATSNGVECTACVEGTYKATTGVGGCSACQGWATSPAGSTSVDACVCFDGFFVV
jgi:hypothetical protein